MLKRGKDRDAKKSVAKAEQLTSSSGAEGLMIESNGCESSSSTSETGELAAEAEIEQIEIAVTTMERMLLLQKTKRRNQS